MELNLVRSYVSFKNQKSAVCAVRACMFVYCWSLLCVCTEFTTLISCEHTHSTLCVFFAANFDFFHLCTRLNDIIAIHADCFW